MILKLHFITLIKNSNHKLLLIKEINSLTCNLFVSFDLLKRQFYLKKTVERMLCLWWKKLKTFSIRLINPSKFSTKTILNDTRFKWLFAWKKLFVLTSANKMHKICLFDTYWSNKLLIILEQKLQIWNFYFWLLATYILTSLIKLLQIHLVAMLYNSVPIEQQKSIILMIFWSQR